MHGFAASLLAALFSTGAHAADINIRSLPDKGAVTLNGKVEKVKDEHRFTLNDGTGSIDVDIAEGQSVVLEPGENVTVFGEVEKSLTGMDINASKVAVHKGVARTVSDAVAEAAENPRTVTVDTLPDQGLVQITGTVSDVDNEKEFTLKDATGSVNVDIKSAEAAALTEGAEVSVTGYVDKGLVGKDINATRIEVIADATPVAGKTQ